MRDSVCVCVFVCDHFTLSQSHSSPMERSPIEGVGYYSLSMAQGVVSHTPAEPTAELEGTERREFLEVLL